MANAVHILVFDDYPYIIDTEQRALRHCYMRERIIPFADLKSDTGYYLLLGRQDIHIPADLIDRPGSVSELMQLSINIASQERGWGIFTGDEQLGRRLSGELPHIDLAGSEFTVDWRLRELRETAAPWNKLNLEEMEIAPTGEGFVCYFNTETQKQLVPDGSLTELPENVVLLEIPPPTLLDPVAVSREYGIGSTGLLTRHPLQKELSAIVKPLAETNLPTQIEMNRQRPASAKSTRLRR